MSIVGKAPPANSSYQLIDGRWVLAVAAGLNRPYQSGFTAHAGGTKAAALQLPAQVAFLEVDTTATNGDSVLLPAALSGMEIKVWNNGAATLDIYGRGTDTINQSVTATAYTLTAGQAAHFCCAKNGSWFAIKTA